MWQSATGIIQSDLKQFDNNRPYWTILSVDRSIGLFYQRQIEVAGFNVCAPLAGYHISLVKKEYVKPAKFPKKLEFEYYPVVETNGKHWWLPVRGATLESFRLSLGLSALSKVPFHLTVAVQADSEDKKGIAPKEICWRVQQLNKMRLCFPEYVWETLPEAAELIRIQQLYTF